MNPFEYGLTGGLEILVILLLVFLAIGPMRVIRAARWARKLGKPREGISLQATKTDKPKKQERPRAKPRKSVQSGREPR